MSGEPQELWLFGYGSLIFKPPPKYDLRVPGYIEGYVRRFWQASEDHRGTPEDPGRVVTLIDRKHWEGLVDKHAEAPMKVWGAAYRIPPKDVAEMKEYLDIREVNGYSINYTAFQVAGEPTLAEGLQQESTRERTAISSLPRTIQCLVYIGLPSNPQFLGPQDPQILADKIVRSRGPSGENVEYLLKLEEALNHLSPDSGDDHVTDLAKRCRSILDERNQSVRTIGDADTDGREETEK